MRLSPSAGRKRDTRSRYGCRLSRRSSEIGAWEIREHFRPIAINLLGRGGGAVFGEQPAQRKRRLLAGRGLWRLGDDLVDCLAHQLVGRHALGFRDSDELGLLLGLQWQSDGHVALSFFDYALIMYPKAT